MKQGIHPKYEPVTVACACGNSFVTRSTSSRIRVEICSNCHPFYTGRQKLVDTAGRLERFAKRYESTGGKTLVRKPVARKPAPASRVSKKAEKVLRSTPKPGAKAKPSKGEKAAKTPKAEKPAGKAG